MRRQSFLVTSVALVAVLVAGGLFASNMGFKQTVVLQGPDLGPPVVSLSGTNTLGLPYNTHDALNNQFDLLQDINAAAGGASVAAGVTGFVRTNDGLTTYDGSAGIAPALDPGVCYRVVVTTDVPYIVVGTHDPGLVVEFLGPGSPVPPALTNVSLSGTNAYSYPYHSTAANANDLINEINAAAGANVVAAVTQFVKTNDGLDSYDGSAGTAFDLVVGECYRVAVTQDVSFVPSHF